jgi:putative aldouronate transport system substrate-binding protein
MKGLKRFGALVLVVLMLISVLAGCKEKPSDITPLPAPVEGNDETPEPAEEQPDPTQGAFEPVTLQWLSATSNYSGPWTGWFADYILERTGVKIELVQASGERMQAMLASGELSDLVTFDGWGNVDSAIKGGMLVNLDEHLDKLPNVVANTGKALDYVRDERSGDTGDLYVVPDYIGEYRTPIDTGVYAANIRWDIYKAIGAPEIKTMDDFLPVLKEMQEYYPETEDGQKVYAFSFFPDWDYRTMYATASLFVIQGHFEGLTGAFLDWNTKDDIVTPLLERDGLYVRTLEFYNDAYRMGLLDPDSMTQTQPNGYAKLQAGAILTAWNCWDGKGAFNHDENINADPPKGFMPVIFDDYYAATMGDYPIGTSSPLGIGSNCKDVEAALRFMDMLANPDDLMILYNGPEGVLWEIGSDGKPHITEKYDEYVADPTMEFPGGGTLDKPGLRPMIMESTMNPKYGVPYAMAYWDEPISKQVDNKLARDWSEFYGYETPIKLIEDQGRLVKRPLAHNFMEMEPDDINAMANQIGEVVKTNSWKMVYAKDDAEFEALYQDMVEKAEGLGVDQVMDWAKGAYERAKARASRYE